MLITNGSSGANIFVVKTVIPNTTEVPMKTALATITNNRAMSLWCSQNSVSNPQKVIYDTVLDRVSCIRCSNIKFSTNVCIFLCFQSKRKLNHCPSKVLGSGRKSVF